MPTAAPNPDAVVPTTPDPIDAIEPAIDAAASRAAIERIADPVDAAATIAPVEPVVVPPVELAAPEATVLPEPTLVAEPGLPQPLVTASPPLAAEPSALDVVRAEAAAVDTALGLPPVDPGTEREAPHFAAAGQPMLAIEPAPALSAATVAAEAIDAVPAQAAASSAERFTVVQVVGPRRGRWRAGLAFGPTPRRFLVTSISPRQLDALLADPLLAVGITEVSAADLVAAELDAIG